MRHSLSKMHRIISTTVLVLCLTVSAAAEIVSYTFSGVFTNSNVSNSISVGDRYTLSFFLNTDATDADPAATTARFASAISNLSFTLSPSATGSYGGGTLSSTSLYVYTETYHPVIEDGAWLGMSASGTDTHTTGFSFAQDDANQDVSLIEFALIPIQLSTFTLSAEPSQTLQSATGAIDLALYDQSAPAHGLRIMFGSASNSASANIDSITQTVVPEPAAYAQSMTFIVLLYTMVMKRRRSAS